MDLDVTSQLTLFFWFGCCCPRVSLSIGKGRQGSGVCFSDSRPRGSGVVSILVDRVRVGLLSESVFFGDLVVSEVWDSPIRDLHI